MKKFLVLQISFLLVFLLSACNSQTIPAESSNQPSAAPTINEHQVDSAKSFGLSAEELDTGIKVLEIVDDVLSGNMSPEGATKKIKVLYEDFNAIDHDSPNHTSVALNISLAESAMASSNSTVSKSEFVDLQDARDYLAIELGKEQMFATSERDSIISYNNDFYESAYDQIKQDDWAYGSSRVYRYIYRANKGDEPCLLFFVFFSRSQYGFLWQSAASLSAYIATSEYDNAIVSFYYNAKPIATYYYDSSAHGNANDLTFADNLVELPYKKEYTNPEFQKEFEREDFAEYAEAVKSQYKSLLIAFK